MTGELARPLRRDAARNRRLILEAARSVFSERGLDAGLYEVARRAGVGVGTVYRRFPDKAQLIVALLDDVVEQFAHIADAAVADADPWRGLCSFFEQSMSRQANDRGLRQFITATEDSDALHDALRDAIQPRLVEMLHRAQADGHVRPEIEVGDLAQIPTMIAAVIDAVGTDNSEIWRRYLALILDGLRAHPDSARLPGEAPALV